MNDAADRLEKTFMTGVLGPYGQHIAGKPLGHSSAVITAEQVRTLVSQKSYRVSAIAERLGAQKRDVEKIIADPSSGMKIGDKGWVGMIE